MDDSGGLPVLQHVERRARRVQAMVWAVAREEPVRRAGDPILRAQRIVLLADVSRGDRQTRRRQRAAGAKERGRPGALGQTPGLRRPGTRPARRVGQNACRRIQRRPTAQGQHPSEPARPDRDQPMRRPDRRGRMEQPRPRARRIQPAHHHATAMRRQKRQGNVARTGNSCSPSAHNSKPSSNPAHGPTSATSTSPKPTTRSSPTSDTPSRTRKTKHSKANICPKTTRRSEP